MPSPRQYVVAAVVVGCVGELVNQLVNGCLSFPGLIFVFWWLDTGFLERFSFNLFCQEAGFTLNQPAPSGSSRIEPSPAKLQALELKGSVMRTKSQKDEQYRVGRGRLST